MMLFLLAGLIGLLLFLVLREKVPVFLALLLVSVLTGLCFGLPPSEIVHHVRQGMGGTLGFVAVVVGLGTLFGAMLEVAGGVQRISRSLLRGAGPRAPLALALIGFLVSIPVFFDVAFILLAPVLFGLAARTGQPVVRFALPLLAGLAATHAFIPPTPGPIAVAELLSAPLGWVILWGILAGLPAVYVGGPLWSRWVTQPGLLASGASSRPEDAPVEPVDDSAAQGSEGKVGSEDTMPEKSISFLAALATILLPLVLILGATFSGQLAPPEAFQRWIQFFGHPFIALLVACLIAYAILRFRLGIAREALVEPLGRALEPAGVIILVTGAGGVFKQMLVETGVGARLADGLTAAGLSPVIYAFVLAAVVRVAQGSATVAMITAAGLTAPVVDAAGLSPASTALLVIAIASGATVLSHVNDSGFWLVSRYLNLSVGETLRTWTVTSTLVGLVGFIVALVISLFLP